MAKLRSTRGLFVYLPPQTRGVVLSARMWNVYLPPQTRGVVLSGFSRLVLRARDIYFEYSYPTLISLGLLGFGFV